MQGPGQENIEGAKGAEKMSTLRSVKVICPICGDKEEKMIREAGILHEGNLRMYKLRCYHCGKQFWHGVKEK